MTIFRYTYYDLVTFWNQQGRKVWNEYAVLQQYIDDILDVVGSEELIEFITQKGYSYEKTCEIMWWIHLYSYCTRGQAVLKDNLWIFNTPDNPFEKYLVDRLYSKGINAYEVYETNYPVV